MKTKIWILAYSGNVLVRIGGRSSLGRILETLRREGHPADGVLCPAAIMDAVGLELNEGGFDCRLVPDDTAPAELAAPDELLILGDGDVVYDPRLIALASRWDEPAVMVDSNPPAVLHERPHVAGGTYAGWAAVNAGVFAAAVTGSAREYSKKINEFGALNSVDIDRLNHYSRANRRPVRHYWIQVADDADRRTAKKMMVAAGGKGHQELAVLLFNRPVETFLSYYVCDWRITPNQITLIGNIIAYGTTALFAFGHFWWGILVALVTEVMDGLDGRQARIQIRTSKLGEFEHVLDKIHEFTWMLALAWYFSHGFENMNYLWATAVWVVAHNLDNLSYSVFRARRGMVIDEASTFDAAVRLFASNRNNNILFLAVGLAFGHPVAIYWFIIFWSIVTPLIHWIRVGWLLSRKAE